MKAVGIMNSIEQRTIAKVTWRLVPFLIGCYFFAYLDRVNIGFAALTMNKDLNFSATVYSQGAGIFFWAYFLFEVPSNLFLEKFGARKWIARIMLSWGIFSASMVFVSGQTGFLVIRALLGVAEAGFFPGIIFYLTLWFPAAYRARILGWFIFAIPISSAIGAPFSSWILGLDGAFGLAGWKWLFLLEAVPSMILAFVVWFYLTDRPRDAAWLAPDERKWLAERLDSEARTRETHARIGVLESLYNPRVLILSIVYFGIVAGLYSLGFFLPQIVKNFGLSNMLTGWVTAIPYVVSAIGMVLWGRHSDARQERKVHTLIPLLALCVGLALAAITEDPILKMTAISVAGLGCFAAVAMFWTLPTSFLTGAAAAAGIALINSIGNLAGYFGPTIMGVGKDLTGSFNGGLLVLAAFALVAAGLVFALGHDPSLERPSQ